jgi:hypothetical protein
MPASNDPTETDDLELIMTLADQLGWSRFRGEDDDTVIKVGDSEVQFAVAVRDGVHLVEKIDRDRHRTLGTFATGAEARRFLIMELAASARQGQPATADPTPKVVPGTPSRPAGPVAVPPPDAFLERDREVIKAVAHELGWRLTAVTAPDLLAVASDDVGRVIAFRQGNYVYESFTNDHRYGKASFSSFRSARRFMIMDMAIILRMQRGLPPLRPSRPADGFGLERTPTGYRLVGPECDATFAAGPIGHRYALDFSRVATAEPDQIFASFLDPGGAPLFS